MPKGGNSGVSPFCNGLVISDIPDAISIMQDPRVSHCLQYRILIPWFESDSTTKRSKTKTSPIKNVLEMINQKATSRVETATQPKICSIPARARTKTNEKTILPYLGEIAS